MNFLPPEIEKYSEDFTEAESPLLHELNRETHLKVLRPRMLSGHLQGKFLEMISFLVKPKKILEIGTYTGYSALCLAQGLQKDGILHTIEFDPEREPMIQKWIEKSNLTGKIVLHIGDAAEVIPTLIETFDLVFIDADKENYSLYFDLVIDKVPSGGLIIADNVLWSGKVTENYSETDFETQKIMDFNKKVHQDSRVSNLLLPVRDGLMLLRKI